MKTTLYPLLALLLPGLTFSASSAPITFNTALPVAKHGFINREQFLYRSFARDSLPSNRNLESQALVSVLGYGVNSKFAIFAVAPYINKSLDISVDGERYHRTSKGLGDIKLFGRYTLYQQDSRNRTFRFAVFGGTEAPTGKHNRTDVLGRLPSTLQSGSGAWDGFAGTIFTYQTLDYQIDAQFRFFKNGRANDFREGAITRADLSLQYRLLPATLRTDTGSFLYGVLELAALNKQRSRADNTKIPNSGGNSVYLTPGIQYVTRKYILETALQIPVLQKLHGSALKTDYIFSVGFRVNI